MNSNGPRTDPWGMPYGTWQLDDCLSRIRRDWCLSDRYEMNQFNALPLTPYDRLSRRKRILWSTASNAAVISRMASTDWLSELESSALMRLEYTFNSAVSVEWPCLYADWFGGSREWVSTCDCSWLLVKTFKQLWDERQVWDRPLIL